jgi:hypothetical protein
LNALAGHCEHANQSTVLISVPGAVGVELSLLPRIWLANRLLDPVELLVPLDEPEGLRRLC